jgi:AcrR family transcriptional regulator
MDDSSGGEPPRPGLRERKKAKTRALIQGEAVRLFREQGYEETSVEQIAEAAEVSPSTVFRYFPTKRDLVIYDDLDERMIEAVRTQPPELTAIQVLRRVVSQVFRGIGEQDLALQRDRAELIVQVPELRGAMLDELVRTLREIADLVAERTGRPADDDDVLALSGAVIGISIAAWFANEDGAGSAGVGTDWMPRFLERMDRGAELLENGFRL